jgi:prephenate dehydrogenase
MYALTPGFKRKILNDKQTKLYVNRLAIIGVGLIGGSLARALKRAGCVDTVMGYGRTRASLDAALRLGVIDDATTDLATAVAGAELVVLAAPLATTSDLLDNMRDVLHERAVVTDVGSVKGSIVKAARAALSPPQFTRFVPGHPIAGTEKSGVEASFAELFDRHRVILTPVAETDPNALHRVRRMWQEAGAEVVDMPVDQHDAILAATSHLPHMLAYALVDCLAGMAEHEDIFRFAAGGFADFTRIASSNPQMWHDICFANRDELLQALDRFQQHLSTLRDAIRANDRNTVIEMFVRAKEARDLFAALRAEQQPAKGTDRE